MSTKYLVCRRRELIDLEEVINQHISDGWEVQGGPSRDDGCYIQAVILKEKEQPKRQLLTEENKVPYTNKIQVPPVITRVLGGEHSSTSNTKTII